MSQVWRVRRLVAGLLVVSLSCVIFGLIHFLVVTQRMP